jgi:hypothetical protein
MARKRHSAEQIIHKLREAEVELPRAHCTHALRRAMRASGGARLCSLPHD